MCELMQHSITKMYAHNINLIKICNNYLCEKKCYYIKIITTWKWKFMNNIHNEWRPKKHEADMQSNVERTQDDFSNNCGKRKKVKSPYRRLFTKVLRGLVKTFSKTILLGKVRGCPHSCTPIDCAPVRPYWTWLSRVLVDGVINIIKIHNFISNMKWNESHRAPVGFTYLK